MEMAKPSFTTRTQIRERCSKILGNPNLSDKEWMEAVEKFSKFFPDWQKVRSAARMPNHARIQTVALMTSCGRWKLNKLNAVVCSQN